MKTVISKPHPNIFAWTEYIQREEAVTKAKIQSFRSGATVPPRRRRMKEKRIQTLLLDFELLYYVLYLVCILQLIIKELILSRVDLMKVDFLTVDFADS